MSPAAPPPSIRPHEKQTRPSTACGGQAGEQCGPAKDRSIRSTPFAAAAEWGRIIAAVGRHTALPPIAAKPVFNAAADYQSAKHVGHDLLRPLAEIARKCADIIPSPKAAFQPSQACGFLEPAVPQGINTNFAPTPADGRRLLRL